MRSLFVSVLVVVFACGDDGGGGKQPDASTSGVGAEITTPPSLPSVIAGNAIVTPIQLEALGDPPITWVVATAPAGLTLSSDGAIAGTPTEHGTFTLSVTASNQFG